ncbi:hypothetical protein [Lactobacillus crispatus]
MVVTNRLVKRMDTVEARVDHVENTSELNEVQRYKLLQAEKSECLKW